MTDLNDEQFVSAAFSSLDEVDVSANLRRRVAQIPIEHPREAQSAWPLARFWQSLVAFGALGAVGFSVGTWSASAGDLATEPVLELSDGGQTEESFVIAENAAENAAESVAENAADQTTQDDDPLEGLFALALSEEWESWELGEGWDSEWLDDGAAPREITR